MSGLRLTARILAEIAHHEGIVCEAYRDIGGVWTWGVGLTAAAGVDPLKWRDRPADLDEVLATYVRVVRARYLPPVAEALGDDLGEAALGGALSFQYNTGALDRAEWVAAWRAGDAEAARAAFLTWDKNGALRPRRAAEAALFFDGTWSGDGTAPVLDVSRNDHRPDPASLRRIDVLTALARLL